MQIELIISTDTLGDVNTDADNQRYADAVLEELKSEYPDAEISVGLVSNVSSGSCRVSCNTDDEIDTDEIKENVNLIANLVWDRADY